MLSEPKTTVTWTEHEIDFGPDVVLDPTRSLVIYDDTHADELLENVVVLDSSYVDLNDGGLAA